MRWLPFVTAVLLLFVSACGAASREQARRSSPDRTYVCDNEAPTGSNITEVVCRTQRQKDEEREETQQRVREMQMDVRPVRAN